MPLPFRSRPCLSVNRAQASLRLGHLKRKLERDKKYHNDYVTFIQDVIAHGDAEEAQANIKEGEVWYIPHHGVYHPKEPNKVRVVFDCLSRHRGTVLNDHLLNCPGLTNALGVKSIQDPSSSHILRHWKDLPSIQCQTWRPRLSAISLVEGWGISLKSQQSIGWRSTYLEPHRLSLGCANYGLKFLSKKFENQFPLTALFIGHHFCVDNRLISTKTND